MSHDRHDLTRTNIAPSSPNPPSPKTLAEKYAYDESDGRDYTIISFYSKGMLIHEELMYLGKSDPESIIPYFSAEQAGKAIQKVLDKMNKQEEE